MFKGWRTLAINATTVVTVAAWPQVIEVITPQYLVLGVAIANFVLRFLTSTPVGSSSIS